MAQADISAFEKKLTAPFKDRSLLLQAFVHRSYLNENPQFEVGHNERLEFLGDAVLELVVTDYLYKSYPKEDEGTLTAYRSALVNAVTIAQVAQDLSMNDYLILSRGEAKDNGRARQIILANTFEALVGALYLDQGYEAARDFITEHLLPRMKDILADNLWLDAKSYFQERSQDSAGVTPSYQVISETGPDHDKRFTVGVHIGGELIAKGSGHSKQEAEQDAARKGLRVKRWTPST